MRKLVVALCLLMEASTAHAAQLLPPGPTYQQVLFGECLRKGFNVEYCDCWVKALPPPPPPREISRNPLRYEILPYPTGFDQIWTNARCENPLTPT